MSKLNSVDDRQFVTALARGLELLRCFNRPGLELSVSELARQTGLSQPTTWRLAHTLLHCGYLVRGGGGASLKVGAPALTLGYAAIRGMSLPEIARPYLRQVTDAAGGTTTLSVLEGVEMIAIEQALGDLVAPGEQVGWRAALTSGPSGLAALAAMMESEFDAIIPQLRARSETRWPDRNARIKSAKSQYDEKGFVTLLGMRQGQFSAVAVPMSAERDDGRKHWAISCGGYSGMWTADRLETAGERLRWAAKCLEPALLAMP